MTYSNEAIGKLVEPARLHRSIYTKEEIFELEMERIEAIRHSEEPSVDMVRQLLQLKGIGLNSAWLYTMEFFSWRKFRNRKEVGALAGLTPTPHESGSRTRYEQGGEPAHTWYGC